MKSSWYFILWICCNTVAAFLPVIMMHGIMDNEKSMQQLIGFIEKAHPGTVVYNVPLYDNMDSFKNMWRQSEGVTDFVKNITSTFTSKYHVIGYSQSGLIFRTMIESLSNHRVENFIVLSSPQPGFYGLTEFLQWFFPGITLPNAYKILYTEEVQKKISFANYWRDPKHHNDFLTKNEYLPLINNEVDHPKAAEYKANFLRINNLVLIGGPTDEIITPWQAAHFGFYDSDIHVQPMENQLIYQQDTFGLKTLNNAGRLFRYVVPGVLHEHWNKNQTVFDLYVKQYLT